MPQSPSMLRRVLGWLLKGKYALGRPAVIMGASCSGILKRGRPSFRGEEIPEQAAGNDEECSSCESEGDVIIIRGEASSLIDACVRSICKNIGKFESLDGLPDELVQQIFNTLASKKQLRCAHLHLLACISDVSLPNYPCFDDQWLHIIGASRFHSITLLDVSGCTDVTDRGVGEIACLPNIRTLRLDGCLRIGDASMQTLGGMTSIAALSVVSCARIGNPGIACLGSLHGMTDLNLEQLGRLTDEGMAFLKSLSNLKTLNVGWCKSRDGGPPLPWMPRLSKLSLCALHLPDHAFEVVCALSLLTSLQLNNCRFASSAPLAHLSRLRRLKCLDLGQCEMVTDDTMACLSGSTTLEVLLLAHTHVTDVGIQHLATLARMRTLVLDCCHVTNGGLLTISQSMTRIQRLDMSDNSVTSSGVATLASLTCLTSLNLFSTGVSDAGIAHLTGLVRLKQLNIDSRLVTDPGLAFLAPLTALEELDLFGAKITADGTRFLQPLERLRSLEMCGGGITDVAVFNIAGLTSLETLNISQNEGVTGASIDVINGFTGLKSLNLAGTLVDSLSAKTLTVLTNLSSLCISGCRINAATLHVLQCMPLMMHLTAEPNP